MVCCDVCGSWSHLSRIGVKAGVSLMEGNDFVCFFCISTCLLALRKEVRRGIERGNGSGEKGAEENEKLKCLEGMVQKGSEKLEVNEKEGPVDAGVEGELVTEDKVRKSQLTDGENQTRCQQSQSAGNQRSEKQLNKEGQS